MPGRVAQVIERVRTSLWFVPAVSIAFAAALAFAAMWASSVVADSGEAGGSGPFFGGGPEAARAILQAIAGSLVTVTGVTFSITVVAIQLASSQFSPRVLRTFLRDLGTQIPLGIFMGTFAYALLVLQSVRSAEEGGDAYVPSVALTVAVGLALVAIGAIVFFIHHIAQQVQISTIVDQIGKETSELIRRTWPDRSEADGSDSGDAKPPGGDGVQVRASRSGFVQYIAVEPLVSYAERHGTSIAAEVEPGSWVDRGAVVLTAFGDPPDDVEGLDDHVTIGSERTMQQDPLFGVRQLADIAIKALSPSINDPTTATYCVNRVATILVAAGERRDPPAIHRDDDGQPRLYARFPGFDQLVAVAFDQLRHYGADDGYVISAVADALARVASRVPADRHGALRTQARELADALDRINPRRLAPDIARTLEPLLDDTAAGQRGVE